MMQTTLNDAITRAAMQKGWREMVAGVDGKTAIAGIALTIQEEARHHGYLVDDVTAHEAALKVAQQLLQNAAWALALNPKGI